MKSIKKNFIWNTALKVSAIVFPLIIYPYISRTVGIEGVGKVSFATSVISYFTIISQLGIPTYGIRAVAQAADDKDNLSKTTQEILRINIITTIMAYLILFLAIIGIPRLREDNILLIITSVEMLFNVIGMVWLFSGLEQYSYITIRSLVFKIVSLVLIFAFVHSPEDYLIYASILVFSIVGSNVLNLIYSRKFVSFKRYTSYDYRRHLKPIMVFFLMSVATTIYTSLDTIMLGFMTNDAEVGLYTSATKIRSVLLGIINALAVVMLPRSSYYIKNGMKKEFIAISQRAFRFIVLIAWCTWVYFSIFAEESILLLSGDEFINATYPMIWIMPTILICGVSNLTAIQMLVSMGEEKKVLITQIIGAVIDFALNLILIPFYGSSAAAFSTMFAELVILIVQIHFLHMDGIFLNDGMSIIKKLISLIIASLSALWVKFVFDGAFIRLAISSVLFFGVYGLLLLLLKDESMLDVVNEGRKMLTKKHN